MCIVIIFCPALVIYKEKKRLLNVTLRGYLYRVWLTLYVYREKEHIDRDGVYMHMHMYGPSTLLFRLCSIKTFLVQEAT